MTNGTTTYKPGDVVLVPFPFTNLATVKERPALVISSLGFNRAQEDIILLAITSNPSVSQHDRNTLSLTKNECRRGGLFFPSFIKTAKIITLDQRLIRKQLGALSTKSTKDAVRRMGKIFDL